MSLCGPSDYRYCWNVHRDFASQRLLDSLPSIFHRRCAMQAHGDMLRKFKPFNDVDEHFLAQLATKLRLEICAPHRPPARSDRPVSSRPSDRFVRIRIG